MRQIPRSSSFARTVGVAIGVAALGASVFAPAQAAVSGNGNYATINTHKSWNGSQEVVQFGCPESTTYGQVITIPAGMHRVKHFVFYMDNYTSSGSMVVRGEIYAWDGRKATGTALFESAPRTISYGDSTFHREQFRVSGAAVTPGAKYVIFASIDKDYEQCTGGYQLGWGDVADSVYKGGQFVYQNNAGAEGHWTTRAWHTWGVDSAFRVFLGT